MRDEDFRDAVRSAEAGDQGARDRLRSLSARPDPSGLNDEALWALRLIDEDVLAEREGAEASAAIKRLGRLGLVACCAAALAPLPSMGWRGVLEAVACLAAGILAGKAFNRWIVARAAAARRKPVRPVA